MTIRKSIFLFMCFFHMTASGVTIEDNQLSQIKNILNSWRARSGIPSATLSILLPNRSQPLTFTSGTTANDRGVRTKENTLFQAGSITKSFTATIILELEAEGKLNIEDPITDYLPQYSRWRDVTIRQLLNHTSGIFNYTETGLFNSIRKKNLHAEFTPEQIVRLASQHRDYFKPGKGWKYSNTNYVLAGMIIEKVTGKPVNYAMNHYLLRDTKLNLYNTYYLSGLYSNEFISRMARGYSSSGSDVTTGNMSWANTAGAIVTTSEDLLKWWQGLFRNSILPPRQMAKMMNLVCENSSHACRAGQAMPHLSGNSIGKGYGLGIIQSAYGSKRLGSVWWHNGSTKGYKALVMWYPQNDIYMALTIDRDPGYLLKPNLPIIRRILNVLVPESGHQIAHSTHRLHHRHKKHHHTS